MSFAERGLAGAALILAAALLRGLLGRALPRRAAVALWWAAAARLLLPWEIPCRFSVYTLLGRLRSAAVPAALPAVKSAAAVQVLPNPGLPVPQAAEEAAAFPAVSPGALLWAVGSLLLAIWFAAAYIRCRQKFKESLPVDSVCVARWVREHPGIPVRVSDRTPAPLVYGIFRPVILLPKRMDWGDETALRHILAHEYVHIRHLDGGAKLVFAGALCLHWWNPAVWLLYVLANRDLELACDEAVVRKLGDPAAYARTLLRMEETRAGLYVCFSQSPMEERIKAIMKFQQKRVPLLLTACALLLAVCVTTAFATSARGEVSQRQTLAEAAVYDELTINGIAGDEPIDLSLLPWLPQPEQRAVSEEVAAGWAETLAPYLPLGLEYTFDDPDHDGNGLRMTYQGREVRGILDGESWITEHIGSGLFDEDAGELRAVYADGSLTGLAFLPEEEQALWTARRVANGAGAMAWPTEGVRISSEFGGRAAPGGAGVYFHSGVDIVGGRDGVTDGAPVYAALDGTVAETGYDAGLGNYVLLRHEDGLETLYAHCREVCTAAGDEVARGETIALVGSTGQSTGPHLHFEVRQDGEAQNPLDYFKAAVFSFTGGPAEN